MFGNPQKSDGLRAPIKFGVQRAEADQLSGHEKTDVEEHAIVPTRSLQWPNGPMLEICGPIFINCSSKQDHDFMALQEMQELTMPCIKGPATREMARCTNAYKCNINLGSFLTADFGRRLVRQLKHLIDSDWTTVVRQLKTSGSKTTNVWFDN